MMPRSEAGRIAYEACQEQPTIATKTLARELQKLWPNVYSSIEHARSSVRRYRGQEGQRKRDTLKHRDAYSKGGDDRRGKPEAHTIPSARILVFDIETSPLLALPWGCFKQFINPEQLLYAPKVICWAAKWLDSPKMMTASMDIAPDTPLLDFFKLNDHDVVEKIWHLFDEADIVIAHNGRCFDTTHLNTRWLDMGMPPPAPYQVIDTLTIAKKHFRFPRNKLDSIGRYLDVGKKLEHEGFDLWLKCMCGDRKAWNTMIKYNKQDVTLLEQLYLRMRPWASRHPNVSLDYDDVMRCVACGSTAIKSLPKSARTTASTFDAFRCESCGKVMRSRSRHKPSLPASERLSHAL